MVQENSINTQVLVICGPTCSGKSSLAIECAKLLDTEIISADSMNVYKGLDIGTAKPTKDEQSTIIHHGVDVVSASSSFSVGDYKEYALPILENLLKKGKIPIICGGTGFYINSLLFELSYGQSPADLVVREKYLSLAEQYGNQYVFNILYKLDPKSAQKLHYNDVKRVIRALEIVENGIKKSDIMDEMRPQFNYKAFSIDFERENLYSRIDYRVDEMIKSGLENEVKTLIDKGITIENQCMQGIGYKEMYAYLMGEYDLQHAIDLIKLNTRHYAKRQITFFKKLQNLTYLSPENVDKMAERIIKSL